MKKFIQYTAVLGAVLTVLGFGTASAAHVQGGRWSQMQVWRGMFHTPKEHGVHVPVGADTGTVLEERTRSFSCQPEFSLEVDFGNVIISAAETEEILISCETGADFHSLVWPYVEDGEMKLVIYGKRTDNRKPNVEVVIPVDYQFREVDIELGGGSCTVQGLKTIEFSAETAGGDIIIEEGEASSVDFSCGAGGISWNGKTMGSVDIDCAAGNVTYRGEAMGNVEVDCAAGNVYLELPWQEEQDFNYELDGTGGNIQVGDKSFSGIVFSKETHHGAPRTMELQCAAGNIQVVFGVEETAVEELPYEAIPFEAVEIDDIYDGDD